MYSRNQTIYVMRKLNDTKDVEISYVNFIAENGIPA